MKRKNPTERVCLIWVGTQNLADFQRVTQYTTFMCRIYEVFLRLHMALRTRWSCRRRMLANSLDCSDGDLANVKQSTHTGGVVTHELRHRRQETHYIVSAQLEAALQYIITSKDVMANPTDNINISIGSDPFVGSFSGRFTHAVKVWACPHLLD